MFDASILVIICQKSMTFKSKVPHGPKYFHLNEEKGQLFSQVILSKLAFKMMLHIY